MDKLDALLVALLATLNLLIAIVRKSKDLWTLITKRKGPPAPR